MDKSELLAQYDRFISQLRVEVDQTFWLYNFFFAVDSALLGTVFLRKLEGWYLLLAVIVGLCLSIYWLHIMDWKDEWRKSWLKRIRKIENNERLKIQEDLQMWPDDVAKTWIMESPISATERVCCGMVSNFDFLFNR